MSVRAVVEFPDDCADAVTEWATVEAAERWGAAMEGLTPGAVLMDLQFGCPRHGWDEPSKCADCGEQTCPDELVEVAPHVMVCRECVEGRGDAECACPGEREGMLGHCSCGAHS